MKRLEKPLMFSVAMVPITFVAIIFTCLYQFEVYSPEIMNKLLAQFGSEEAIIAASIAQSTILIFVCSFFGYIMANKLGLWKPFGFERLKVLRTVEIGSVVGIILSMDYWTFGSAEPMIQESTKTIALSYKAIIASILYGGIDEELLMRLFFLSLIAWGIWKIRYRKTANGDLPKRIFVIANVIAAILFAAGHLPVTVTVMGTLTPLMVIRCFLFNGGLGLVFGKLYYTYGIWYAMLGHVLAHIISKAIWFVCI